MKTFTKILCLISFVTAAFLTSCEDQMDEEKQVKANETNNTSSARLVTNYKLNGKEGDVIDYNVARKWVANYQKANPTGNMAHFFGYEIIKELLAQEGCVGLRMYYAIDDAGERQIILVGVDEKGMDIKPGANGRTKDEGSVADASYPCPTYCSGNGTSM
jgi:hypothetical protein